MMTKASIECYDGPLPYIFVSYSHNDIDEVSTDLRSLYNLGCRIWYDRGIEPGSKWSEMIAGAISNSALFLAFFSPQTASSSYVQKEINYALNLSKPIVPIYLKQTILSPGLRLQLDPIQGVLKYALSVEDYVNELRKISLLSVGKSESQLIDEIVSRIYLSAKESIQKKNKQLMLGGVTLTFSTETDIIHAMLDTSFTPWEAGYLGNRGWQIKSLDGPATREFNCDLKKIIYSIIYVNTTCQWYSGIRDQWGTVQRMLQDLTANL